MVTKAFCRPSCRRKLLSAETVNRECFLFEFSDIAGVVLSRAWNVCDFSSSKTFDGECQSSTRYSGCVDSVVAHRDFIPQIYMCDVAVGWTGTWWKHQFRLEPHERFRVSRSKASSCNMYTSCSKSIFSMHIYLLLRQTLLQYAKQPGQYKVYDEATDAS